MRPILWWFPFASYGVIAAIVAVLGAMAFTPGLASQLYCSVGAFALAGAAFLVLRRE